LAETWKPGLDLPAVLRLAVEALAGDGGDGQGLPASQLEVAVLDRHRPRRAFRRLTGAALEELLAPATDDEEPDAD
jgi:proteasome alpha subunit